MSKRILIEIKNIFFKNEFTILCKNNNNKNYVFNYLRIVIIVNNINNLRKIYSWE